MAQYDEDPLEEEEHLRVVRARRDLLLLEDPGLSYATLLQVARLNLEEAELKPKIRKKKSLRQSALGTRERASPADRVTNTSSVEMNGWGCNQPSLGFATTAVKEFLPLQFTPSVEDVWAHPASTFADFETRILGMPTIRLHDSGINPWQLQPPLLDTCEVADRFDHGLDLSFGKYQGVLQQREMTGSSLSDDRCFVFEYNEHEPQLPEFDVDSGPAPVPMFDLQQHTVIADSALYLGNAMSLTIDESKSSPQTSRSSLQSVVMDDTELYQIHSQVELPYGAETQLRTSLDEDDVRNSNKTGEVACVLEEQSRSKKIEHGSFQCLVFRLADSESPTTRRSRTKPATEHTKFPVASMARPGLSEKRPIIVEIPGTSCFDSRPQPKKSRREISGLDRSRIRYLRLKGACLRCRANHWVCSEDDPCRRCVESSGASALTSAKFLLCLRSISDCNPFAYFESAGIGSLPLMDVKISRGYQVWDCASRQIRCLTFFDEVTGAEAANVDNVFWARLPSRWGSFGSRILTTLDKVVKNKKFWSRREISMQFVIVASIDLIISLLLHLAEWSANHGLCIDGMQHASNYPDHQLPQQRLQELCDASLHCIERLLSLRAVFLERLEAWATTSLPRRARHGLFCAYLEESAMRCLSFVSQHYASPTMNSLCRAIRQLNSQGISSGAGLDGSKERFLSKAVTLNKGTLIQHALDAGADPSIIPVHHPWRCSPLHSAVVDGNTTLIKQLLEAGADTESRDRNNWTPLHVAASCGTDSRTTNNSLLLRLQDGDLPASCAAVVPSVKHRYADIVKVLLSHGANCEAKDSDGKTALHRAVEFDHACIVEVFLASSKRGIDHSDTTGEPKETLLHKAAACGSPYTARLLIRAGAEVDAWNALRFTPLHLITRRLVLHPYLDNRLRSVSSCLLEAAADVNARGRRGETALHMISSSPLSESYASFLIDNGADVHACNDEANTPLHIAAKAGGTGAVTHLLKAGANVNAQNGAGVTPLHLVSSVHGPQDILQGLLEAGADHELRDKDRLSPLDWALWSYNMEDLGRIPLPSAARVLLKAGADHPERDRMAPFVTIGLERRRTKYLV